MTQKKATVTTENAETVKTTETATAKAAEKPIAKAAVEHTPTKQESYMADNFNDTLNGEDYWTANGQR